MLDNLTSLELHLRYPPGAIVTTKHLEDVGAGIYPVFYLNQKNHLCVSSNVTSLIFDKGTFEPNPIFSPPDWRTRSRWRMKLNRIRNYRIPAELSVLRRFIPEMPPPPEPWYQSWETID